MPTLAGALTLFQFNAAAPEFLPVPDSPLQSPRGDAHQVHDDSRQPTLSAQAASSDSGLEATMPTEPALPEQSPTAVPEEEAATELSTQGSSSPAAPLQSGARVQITGLQRRRDLNGRYGVLLHRQSSGRWAVQDAPRYQEPPMRPREEVSCAEANLLPAHVQPGMAVWLPDEHLGIALCQASADLWAVLCTDTNRIERSPTASLEIGAEFHGDTPFPPDVATVDLQELLDAMWTSRRQFADIAREALSAVGGPIAPDAPTASVECLETFVEAFNDPTSRSELRKALHQCASDASAWLALRLADHRLDAEARSTSSHGGAGI